MENVSLLINLCGEIFVGIEFRNANYRDVIQLAAEQVERYRVTLRSLSEADMERSFKLVNQYKETHRLRATFGLAELERCVGEIWKQLMPERSIASTHRNIEENWFRNFIYGHCLDMEPNWRTFFPEVWEIFGERDYYKNFRYVSDRMKFRAIIINEKWKEVVICRCGQCKFWKKKIKWVKA